MTIHRRVFAALLLLAGSGMPLRAQQNDVALALLQFEQAVTWEAVGAEWRGLRPGWTQRVARASHPQDIAALMVILETNMGWQAVEGRWRARRDPWIAEARSARSEAEVARLLLDLEEATLWSAVDASWRGARPGWVARLGAIAGGGRGAPRK